MPKVLGKAGTSLADIYDVEGSVAGVENLSSDDVHLTHEMGSVIFSERFSTGIARLFFDVGQNVTLGGSLPDLPGAPFRLFGFQVVTDDSSRIDRLVCSYSVLDAAGDATQEIPFWVWDEEAGTTIRLIDGGAATANLTLLAPIAANSMGPAMVGGSDQSTVNGITLRGVTAGFGAGIVEITALAYIGFAEQGSGAAAGLSSRGLPIPSW
jgi:hypothetical protein